MWFLFLDFRYIDVTEDLGPEQRSLNMALKLSDIDHECNVYEAKEWSTKLACLC